MSPGDRRKAVVLANAGVANLKHLAVIAGLSHVTVWRYWNTPPRRKDIAVMTSLATALEIDLYELAELLSEGSTGIRYFAQTGVDLHLPFRFNLLQSANEVKSAVRKVDSVAA